MDAPDPTQRALVWLPWSLAAAVAGAGSLGAAVLATSGSLAAATVGIVATGGLAWLWGRHLAPRSGLRAQRHALVALRTLARGRLDALDSEALGDFAQPIFHISERQRAVSDAALQLAGRMRELPAPIADLHADVGRSSTEIEEAVEETASLLAHINSSIRSINSEVENLSHSTEEASSSVLEMGSSVDEVARSAGALHDSVDASTSSIQQISTSIRQVAESADAVQTMAEESAVAMAEMDRAIQEVSRHVGEASELTAQVSTGAEEGTSAVGATIDGIDAIRRQTLRAKTVLEQLAQRIAEIGEIVNVIGSINEETNLLSLNAAIIAAQAGEQGKAFAVVANHVKTLAQRTASSTQQIGALILAVQQESSNAMEAMGAGIEAVETGVARSRRAGEALSRIRVSSHDASSRVAEIARATGEQTRNSTHVAEAAQRTSSMVQQITQAMGEQSHASETMMANAAAALELCRQVHHSTEEQRESGRFIAARVSSISDMARSIQSNTESHSAASEAVSEAVSRILEVARRRGADSTALLDRLSSLEAEAKALAEAGADD